MLIGDIDGALASFDWYENAYPEDGGEPYQYLTWALALFCGSYRQEAFNKLYQTMLENLYISYLFFLDAIPNHLTSGTVATSKGLSTPLRFRKSY